MQQDDPYGSPTSLLPGTWTDPAAPEPSSRHLAAPAATRLSTTLDRAWHLVVETDRRWLLAAVIVVPTLAVFGVVALLPGPPQRAAAALPSNRPSASGPASIAARSAAGARDLRGLTADQTASLLGAAGQSVRGDLDQAWTFRDSNGLNLLVATVETVAVSDYTMRVSLFGDLEGAPRSMTRLADGGLPGCSAAPLRGNGAKRDDRQKRDRSGRGNGNNSGDQNNDNQNNGDQPAEQPAAVLGSAGFTSDSVTLADSNRDGVGEVTIGWSSSCGPAGASSRIQLALISADRTFLVQGDGVISATGNGTLVPEQDPASWPEGSLDSVNALFHQLYY